MESNLFFPFAVGLLVAKFIPVLDTHPVFITILIIISIVLGLFNIWIRAVRRKSKAPSKLFRKFLELKISQGEKILKIEKTRKKEGKETNTEKRLQELKNVYGPWNYQCNRAYWYALGENIDIKRQKKGMAFREKDKVIMPKTYPELLFKLEMDLVFLNSVKMGLSDSQLSLTFDPEKLESERVFKYSRHLNQ